MPLSICTILLVLVIIIGLVVCTILSDSRPDSHLTQLVTSLLGIGLVIGLFVYLLTCFNMSHNLNLKLPQEILISCPSEPKGKDIESEIARFVALSGKPCDIVTNDVTVDEKVDSVLHYNLSLKLRTSILGGKITSSSSWDTRYILDRRDVGGNIYKLVKSE